MENVIRIYMAAYAHKIKDRLVIFDGVCNLCNGTVQFLIRRDRGKRFLFATYQSEAGRNILQQHGFLPTEISTVVYVKNGIPYAQSRAILEIFRDLGCCWNLLYILIAIPPIIRDFIYRYIAKNRYNLFGRRESCMVPDSEIMDRFLQ